MRNLTVLLTLLSCSAYSQSNSDDISMLFDAAVIDESRIHLTLDQHKALRSITRNVREGKIQRALRLWQHFVSSSYVGDCNIDYDALVLAIVRDAFLDSSDIRQITDRYKYYRDLGHQIQDMKNRLSDYASVAGADEAHNLNMLTAKLAEVSQLQEQLRTSTDEANLMMQTALQKKAQFLTHMISAMQALSATSSEVIGNLKP